MLKIVDNNRVHIVAVKVIKQLDLIVIVHLIQHLSKIISKVVVIVANNMPSWVAEPLPFFTGITLF